MNNKIGLQDGEEIRQIKNFEDYYITNYGRVWSNKTNRWLKPTINHSTTGKTYMREYVSLGRGNKKYIHRLVAEAFCPTIEGCEEVDHIDCNPLNNHADNLRWVTHNQNMQNKVTQERIKKNKGGKVEILDTLTNEIYLGYEEAAEKCHVSKCTISNHLKGRVLNPRWVYLNDGKRICG